MYEKLKKEANNNEKAINRLVEIIELLREKCPWDKVQTHESLRVCMIEEAYEVAEAIDKKDDVNLREELGDVLLQVVFHSSLSKSEEKFDLVDVINEECEKMIRRHPHVFLDEDIKTVDKVLEKWENIKVREHRNDSTTSILRGVPKALPALIRSYKVQSKATKVGFDWNDISCAFEKIAEETEELVDAYQNLGQKEITEELGDLLFSVVNVARFLKVEPEQALEVAVDKFTNRFEHIEKEAVKSGRILEEMTLEEMDKFWEDAKQKQVP